MTTRVLRIQYSHAAAAAEISFWTLLVRPFKFGMWVYMGNAMNAKYCFVTLIFNFKVTGGLLKVHFFTFWPSSHIQKVRYPMAGICNTYICPL